VVENKAVKPEVTESGVKKAQKKRKIMPVVILIVILLMIVVTVVLFVNPVKLWRGQPILSPVSPTTQPLPSTPPRTVKIYVDASFSMRGFAPAPNWRPPSPSYSDFIQALRLAVGEWKASGYTTVSYSRFGSGDQRFDISDLNSQEILRREIYNAEYTPLGALFHELAERNDLSSALVITDSVQSSPDDWDFVTMVNEIARMVVSKRFTASILAYRFPFQGEAFSEVRGWSTSLGSWSGERPLYLYALSTDENFFSPSGTLDHMLAGSNLGSPRIIRLLKSPFFQRNSAILVPARTNRLTLGTEQEFINAFQVVRRIGYAIEGRVNRKQDMGYLAFHATLLRSPLLEGVNIAINEPPVLDFRLPIYNSQRIY